MQRRKGKAGERKTGDEGRIPKEESECGVTEEGKTKRPMGMQEQRALMPLTQSRNAQSLNVALSPR